MLSLWEQYQLGANFIHILHGIFVLEYSTQNILSSMSKIIPFFPGTPHSLWYLVAEIEGKIQTSPKKSKQVLTSLKKSEKIPPK